MKPSTIGWTDYSGGCLNFVTGCTPVSPGCKGCYARRIYERFGRDFSQVQTHPDKLVRSERTRFPEFSPKRGAPHKPMAFVCDTGDLFHEAVPDRFIGDAIETMAKRQDVVWQILTKRPQRMQHFFHVWDEAYAAYPDMMAEEYGAEYPFPHIWLGVTAENQAMADERIPILLDTPAAVRFVSFEPLLEEIDCIALSRHLYDGIHWCIVGGESGPSRREFSPDWAANIRGLCSLMDTAFFGKQDSAYSPGAPLLIDGREVHEWPTT